MNNPSKELQLLQQYNRKLQDENTAKTEQIRVLRLQLENQSQAGSRIISSSYVTNVANCSNCKVKQLQIVNLKKSLKDLKDTHETDIKKLGTPKERIIYKQVQSPARRDETEKWRKAYDDLKAKYEQSQKIQWSRIKVDGNESSKQENLALRQKNNQLTSRIQFLQKRLLTVQDANKILTEEIESLKTSSLKPTYQYSQINQSPANHNTSFEVIQPSAPTFRYLPPPVQKVVSFQVEQAPALQYQQNQHSHLSPLAVLEQRSYRQPCHALEYSAQKDYYKNIVQERWRSLQHKIKILQDENGRLRTQFGSPIQYA